MRKIDWFHAINSRNLLHHIHEIYQVEEPLAEKTILELQETFLTNGFHYLKISTPSVGRIIVEKFLKSLNIYHDVACLTLDQNPLMNNVTDMYSILAHGGYLNSYDPHLLEEYFIEHCYFDFIWIEATLNLLTSTWFEDVKQQFIHTAVDQHTPVIVCVYDDYYTASDKRFYVNN